MYAKILDVCRLLLIIFNVYVFGKIVPNTGISFTNLVLILAVFYAAGIILFQWIKEEWKMFLTKFDFFAILMLTLFNSFFFLNYIFSSNPTTENYHFSHLISKYASRYGGTSTSKSTTIILENDAYDDFYLFRTFFDYGKMHDKNYITYHFEEGLFGLKVIKDYKFSVE